VPKPAKGKIVLKITGRGLVPTPSLPHCEAPMKPIYLSLLICLSCTGCAVYAVADTAIAVGATVVKTTAKAAGAVIDAVTPDSKSDKK